MPAADGHVVVLGADGFLGRALIRRLTADGLRVTGIGRQAGDLSDWPTVERVFGGLDPAHRIFHVVTRQRTGAVQYDIQGELLAINSRIHLNVLEGWRRFRPEAKLVSTGSSCTYPESPKPLTEDMFGLGPTHPSVRGYALAKQALAVGSGEYVRQYGLAGYLHCVLATMYGPHDHKAPDRSHFVGALLERAAREKTAGADHFEVWGDPATVREILYVDDQVDAILAADRHFENEILNCAANSPVTVGEVAEAVLRSLRWTVPTRSPAGSFQGAAFKLLDSGRFLERTGWRP
ncbi:MAG: NAD-dependent epimerase/dehydratase family protein, partial [Methylobacteriaceae bacterium]|nr:NAD-dependent epimerase/dehydratase family protein [Methylobacteriaceae bacterium]